MTDQQVTPLALALWARKFATLVGAGVSLMRGLDVLRATSPAPLNEITGDLMDRIQAGSTLSAAMKEYPDVFKRAALLIVRAGEVGGVLDETLAVWAEWLAKDLGWHARFHARVLLAKALGLVKTKQEAYALVEGGLPDFKDRLAEHMYCVMASMMLSSGVPLETALGVAAEACADDPARVESLKCPAKSDEAPVHTRLAEAGFSRLTVQLAAVGEETGQLDRMLDEAAKALQFELETRMTVALSGLQEGMEERASE
jgi:type II secretory pathway component PulF